ncbi:Hypothetical protein DHA2_150205, partial [Giardia duodenalis]
VRLHLGVIVRVRGYRWSTPMRCVGGEAHPSAHGLRCTLVSGPSSSTRPRRRSPCAVCRLGDVWAGPSAPHSTLGGMIRSVEASSKASEAIRTGSPLGCLARQPASIYSRVSGTASCCGRRLAGGPGRHHSPVWAGSVRLCQPDTPGAPSLVEGFT